MNLSIYVHMYVYIYVYMHIYLCIYIYIYSAIGLMSKVFASGLGDQSSIQGQRNIKD